MTHKILSPNDQHEIFLLQCHKNPTLPITAQRKQINLFKLQICPPRIKGKRNIRIYLSMNVKVKVCNCVN